MRIGVAEARERFKEILDRVEAGEEVEITRRGQVVAVLTVPTQRRDGRRSLVDIVDDLREQYAVDEWDDFDPFADVRAQGTVLRPPPF
jgi:prevent-host-death family protein